MPDPAVNSVNDEFVAMLGATSVTSAEDNDTENNLEEEEEVNLSGHEESVDDDADEDDSTKEQVTEKEASAYQKEIDALREDNEEIKNQIAQLISLNKSLLEKKEPPAPAIPDDFDFVSDEEYAEMLQDKKALNNILRKVARLSYDKAKEDTIKDFGPVVEKRVEDRITMQRAVDTFWDSNPELLPHKRYVITTVEEIQSKNPHWTIDKILSKTSTEAYKALKITKQSRKSTEDSKPAFVKGPKSRTQEPKVDALNAEFRALKGKK